MATKTFEHNECRYEAGERVNLNGVPGIIWAYRLKCRDGSGWMHMGKQFNPIRTTRKQIVESFY